LRNCPPLIYTFIQARVKELEERRLAEKKKQLGARTGLEAYSTLGTGIGISSEEFGVLRAMWEALLRIRGPVPC
jgi:hypothetical protein